MKRIVFAVMAAASLSLSVAPAFAAAHRVVPPAARAEALDELSLGISRLHLQVADLQTGCQKTYMAQVDYARRVTLAVKLPTLYTMAGLIETRPFDVYRRNTVILECRALFPGLLPNRDYVTISPDGTTATAIFP